METQKRGGHILIDYLFKIQLPKTLTIETIIKKNSTINNKRSESEVRSPLFQLAIAINPATKANNRFHNNSSKDSAQSL